MVHWPLIIYTVGSTGVIRVTFLVFDLTRTYRNTFRNSTGLSYKTLLTKFLLNIYKFLRKCAEKKNCDPNYPGPRGNSGHRLNNGYYVKTMRIYDMLASIKSVEELLAAILLHWYILVYILRAQLKNLENIFYQK